MSAETDRSSCERGATVLEVALTIGVFLFVVVGGIQLLRVAYLTLATQIVAVTAARMTSLNDLNACPSPTCDTPEGRANYLEAMISKYAQGIGVKIAENDICIRPGNSVACNAANDDDDPGRPRQVMVITIGLDVPLLLGFGTYRIAAQAVGKNEPFGKGGL